MNNSGLLLVFYSKFISITHRFRDNDVFLQTGNDVMVIPLLEGAVRSFRWRILKRVTPKFIFILYWHILPIFNHLRAMSLTQSLKFDDDDLSSSSFGIFGIFGIFDFFILVGISLLPAKFVGFSRKMTPKSQNFEKHLFGGHFLTSNGVFWAIVRGNLFTGVGGMRG